MLEKQVNIEFTRPKGRLLPLFSWLIRALECTKYSHVRLSWTNSTGVPVVYEASGTSLKFIGPLAANRVEVIKTYPVYVDRDGYRRLIKLCMTYAGLDYGVKQLLGILFVKLFKLKKNPLSQGRKSQVCSEIVGRFLEEAMGWKTGLDLDTAGPKDIQTFLERRN